MHTFKKTSHQGRSQKFVLRGYKSFWGWIKLLSSRSDVNLTHKKFTWADFGGINTDIQPRRYALPVMFSNENAPAQ